MADAREIQMAVRFNQDAVFLQEFSSQTLFPFKVNLLLHDFSYARRQGHDAGDFDIT